MATNSKEYNAKNYRKYWGHPSAISDRSERNKARRKIATLRGNATIKGKEVHHKHGVRAGNHVSNLAVTSRSYNRKDGAAKANRRKYGEVK